MEAIDTETKVKLRLYIDGKYSALDMHSLIRYLDELYNIWFLFAHALDPENMARKNWHINQIFNHLSKNLSLSSEWSVRSIISYGKTLDMDEVENARVKSSKDDRKIKIMEMAGVYPALDVNGVLIADVGKRLLHEERIHISKIEYSSPGFVDLVGLGEVMKQIKEFVLGIIQYVGDSKKRGLEYEEMSLKLESDRMDLIKKKIEIAKSMDVSVWDLENMKYHIMGRQIFVENMVYSDKVTGIEEITEEE